MTDHPYLSVVVSSRNDDHGGNLRERMQTFVNGLAAQAEQYELPVELIVVEWNPPADRPGLRQALRWPAASSPCMVRIIEVPAELHGRYRHGAALPLYQMIAKNVGIRRAQGEFVLATNIDILFSDALFAFLAERALERGKMYRLDRYDVPADVPVEAAVADRLAYCEANLIRVYARDGVFPLSGSGRRALAERDIARHDSGISFGPGFYWVEMDAGEPFRWISNDAEVVLASEAHGGVLAFDLEPGPGVGHRPFDLTITDGGGRMLAAERVRHRTVVRVKLPAAAAGPHRLYVRVRGGGLPTSLDPRLLNCRVFRCFLEAEGRRTEIHVPPKAVGPPIPELRDDPANAVCPVELHTRACGDFTLMAREHWFDVRAYAEFDLYSMNIDSVLCYAAHHGGAPEEQLPDSMRVYHIDHSVGSGWTPEGDDALFHRLTAAGIPWLHHLELFGWATQMRRYGRPMIFNRPGWGLADPRAAGLVREAT